MIATRLVQLALLGVIAVACWVFVSAGVLAWQARRRERAHVRAFERQVGPLLARRLAERR